MSLSSIVTGETQHIGPVATHGLSSQEAAERLSKYGPNDPAPVKRGAAVIELLILFVNPLVVILLVASVVSFLLGNVTDAVIILVMVLLGVSINFVQTYRSRRADRQASRERNANRHGSARREVAGNQAA